jgi:predicted nuclease with TOPRIM domain
MLGRRWLMLAGLALAGVGGGVVAVQLPAALDRSARAQAVVEVKTHLAQVHEREASLRDRSSSLDSELSLFADQGKSLDSRLKRLRKQVRERRVEVKELQARVSELGG